MHYMYLLRFAFSCNRLFASRQKKKIVYRRTMAKQKKSKKAKGNIARDLYIVDRILSKRFVNGKVQYYLKWLGYPDSENTWEPKENLKCPSLIYEFEKQLGLGRGECSGDKESEKESRDSEKLPPAKDLHYTTSRNKKLTVMTPSPKASETSPASSMTSTSKATDSAESLQSGFAKGWQAEMILGATEYYGQRLFLIKWFVCLYVECGILQGLMPIILRMPSCVACDLEMTRLLCHLIQERKGVSGTGLC